MPLRLTLAVTLTLLLTTTLSADEAAPAALAERAATALGGRNAVVTAPGFRITLVGSGLSFSGAQARSPRATHNNVPLEKHYLVDFQQSRGRRETSQLSPGLVRFHTLAVVTSEGAQTVDLLKWRSGVDIQKQSATQSRPALAAWARLVPHGALRQALANPSTLKAAAPVERDGRLLDVITYVDPAGVTVTLHLEQKSGLLFSATPGEFPNTSYEYGDYSTGAGIRTPQRLTVRSQVLNEELRYTAVDVRTAPADSDFILPSGYLDPPPLGDPRAVKVADGVYRLDGMPSNYHSAFVVDGKEVAVFDAPQSPEWSEVALKVIRTVVGADARVVRVLISHHHSDHTGGLATYAAAGAAIVTGPGVDEFLRGRLPEPLRAGAKFQVVERKHSFGVGRSRIDAYLVPNEHADGTLAFHIPASQILLQGDLFYIPERGPVPPAFGVTADLERVVVGHKLNVRTIIGVHGRQGAWGELRQSLAARSGLSAEHASTGGSTRVPAKQ